MKKITLVGITHIDISSHEKVSRVLASLKPDAICLELDEYRLKTLIENEELNNAMTFSEKSKDKEENQKKIQNEFDFTEEINDDLVPTESFSGILDDIGFFESELSRVTQSDLPGKEMLIAYKAAKKIGAEIFLIDRSIHDISRVMEEEVSSDEAQKFQNLIDELIFEKNIVAQPIEKAIDDKSLKKPIESIVEDVENNDEINLNEVLEIFKDEDSLSNILQIFNQNFPKLYSILLEDRNIFMSKQILKVSLDYSNIVVILGYGHIKDINSILLEMNSSINVEIAN
jgi:pheromone shutdown protein TraB